MKWIAIALLGGFLFWCLFVFAIAFLQINGMILSGVVQVDFGDANGWQVASAIGTIASAIAASAAAIIALTIERTNSKREQKRRMDIAQAKRATMPLVFSEVSDYLELAAQEYQRLWETCKNNDDGGFIFVKFLDLKKAKHKCPDVPVAALRELESSLKEFPEHLKIVADVVGTIQVTHSRLRGLRTSAAVYSAGYGINVFSQIAEIADAHSKISGLYDWARFRSEKYVEYPLLSSTAMLGLPLEFEQKLHDYIVCIGAN